MVETFSLIQGDAQALLDAETNADVLPGTAACSYSSIIFLGSIVR